MTVTNLAVAGATAALTTTERDTIVEASLSALTVNLPAGRWLLRSIIASTPLVGSQPAMVTELDVTTGAAGNVTLPASGVYRCGKDFEANVGGTIRAHVAIARWSGVKWLPYAGSIRATVAFGTATAPRTDQRIGGNVHIFSAQIGLDPWTASLDAAVDLGLDTVRTSVPWGFIEPTAHGVRDARMVRYVDRFFAACAARGLKVLAIASSGVPLWAKPSGTPVPFSWAYNVPTAHSAFGAKLVGAGSTALNGVSTQQAPRSASAMLVGVLSNAANPGTVTPTLGTMRTTLRETNGLSMVDYEPIGALVAGSVGYSWPTATAGGAISMYLEPATEGVPPAFVQRCGTMNNSIATDAAKVLTIATAATQGNTLVIPMRTSAGVADVVSVVDSRGNVYRWADGLPNSNGHRPHIAYAYMHDPLQIGDTITITRSEAGTMHAAAMEYTGVVEGPWRLDGNLVGGGPDDWANLRDFVTWFVNRYAPQGLIAIESQNEPLVDTAYVYNFDGVASGGWAGLTPADVVPFVHNGYDAIKASAHPEVLMVGGVLAFCDTTLLANLYAAGLNPAKYDAISCHPYPVSFSPQKARNPRAPFVEPNYRNNAHALAALADTMTANGDATHPIWVTEYGVSSGTDNPLNVSPETQADHLAYLTRLIARHPRVAAMLFHTLEDKGADYRSPAPGQWAGFGVHGIDRAVRKPSYAAMKSTVAAIRAGAG